MPSFRSPTPEEVDAALLRIPTFQLRRVFYGGLKNPEWVRPLMEAGAFDNPPVPVPTEDGHVHEPYWPEIDYLIRIAPEAPAAVVDVMLRLESSTNSWVRRAAFEIGSAVPAIEGARLMPLLRAWMPDDAGWRTDPRDMVSFAIRLLEGGETRSGRWLANTLFKPTEPHDDASGLREPKLALERYWYETELPRLVPALGDDALKAVTGWLNDYVRISGHASDEYDFSGMDRPSIESRSEPHRDAEDALVEAVRDLAITAAATAPTNTVDTLLRSGFKLLRKVALFAVAQALRDAVRASSDVSELLGEARRLLADFESDNEYLRVEYAKLAREVADVDASSLEVIRPFLDHAYEVDVARGIEHPANPEASEAERETEARARADGYRHMWLAAIGADVLPEDLRTQLMNLNEDRGEITDPLVPLGIVTSWSGPNPHTPQADMAAMTGVELVDLLADWHDDGNGWGPRPSHEGQGRELAGLLTTHPAALAGVDDLVARLRPTYLRAVLGGWEAALKSGLELDWTQTAGVVEGVLRHPLEADSASEGGDFDDDKDFRGAKKAAVGLLEELLKEREGNGIPEAFKKRFASLLIENARDDDAWAEYDRYEFEGDGWSPLDISLNWEWPKRVRALVVAATRNPAAPWQEAALAALDEELRRIDRHGGARAALGEGLGRLFSYAPSWTGEHLDALVGNEDGLTRDQQITLTTTLATHNYHREFFEILTPAILGAIDIGADLAVGWRRDTKPLARIGEWMVEAIIYGHRTLEDPEVSKYFASASAKSRGEALGHVAWRFFRAESVDEAIRDRFGDLWDERISHVAEHPEDREELTGIYWLAKAKVLPADWWLPRLHRALELEPSIATERYMIGKELALASAANPALSLQVLKLLLDARGQGGMATFDLSRHAVPVVIANAIRSGSDELKRDAESYMNQLGAAGNLNLEVEVQEVLDGEVGVADVDE